MPNSISDLLNAIEYERFFLEQVYKITTSDRSPDVDIELSYTRDGEPRRKAFGRGSMVLGDWRPGFVAAGKPLIFIVAFKILDSMFDWLVKMPSKAAPRQVKQKLEVLKGIPPENMPELFKNETWLFERLIAIYSRAAEFRNTLIHRGDFETSAVGLHVRFGEIQGESERTMISNAEVASLAVVTIKVIRLMAGISTLDVLTRKRIRLLFDGLVSFHGQALLGQSQVQVGRVILNFSKFQNVEFDLSRIREDISPEIQIPDAHGNFVVLKYDTVFDIKIVIDGVEKESEEYLIPCNDVDKYPIGISSEELRGYKTAADGGCR
ncbi:hypothetical protein [Burkholderia glumae]|uniref:hypothetical protein n=1 Tax=Burkholderia glumae TaxID=337 RepID=UPI0021513818|nr:hypothetical protein [Burkholderia glumae]